MKLAYGQYDRGGSGGMDDGYVVGGDGAVIIYLLQVIGMLLSAAFSLGL